MGNNYQLQTNAGGFPDAQSESVLVQRRNKTGTNQLGEPVFDDTNPTLLYSGSADFQFNTGDLVVTKEGEIIDADARCTIEAASVGALPVIDEGDRVLFNSEKFTVILSEIWAFPYIHAELLLKQQVTW